MAATERWERCLNSREAQGRPGERLTIAIALAGLPWAWRAITQINTMPAPESLSYRFVILRHEGSAEYKPGVHWDLMLERDGRLRTWALAELPAADREIDAERLPDHRLAYLDYEGPVSGNRGTVRRIDAGQFEIVSESPDEWIVALVGQDYRGRLSLRRSGGAWRCAYEPA